MNDMFHSTDCISLSFIIELLNKLTAHRNHKFNLQNGKMQTRETCRCKTELFGIELLLTTQYLLYEIYTKLSAFKAMHNCCK